MDSTASPRRVPRAATRFAHPCRLAYFVSRFPTTTETFVVRELNAVEAHPGIEAGLYALFPTPKGVVQESARRWMGRVHRARPLRCIGHAARWFARRPVRFISTLALIVKDHARSPGVLGRSLVTFCTAALYADTLGAAETEHVHAHFASYPALAAWVCHRLTGVPYSFTAHAHDLYVSPLGVPRRTAEAAFVVAISDFNGRLLEELAPDAAPIHVVHCGVDTDTYRYAPHAPPADGPVRALCVASLREKKGHRVLFEALASGAPGLDRVTVDLAGDGPLRAELEAEVARLGLGERVRFHGDVTEKGVAAMLEQADLFVLPSVVERGGDTEGIPVALMEAMAAGIPVIGSRLSGIPELVRNGQTGLLVEPGDARGLAGALSSLLADPSSAVERAARAREVIEREFSLDASSRRLVALFTAQAAPAQPAARPARAPGKVAVDA